MARRSEHSQEEIRQLVLEASEEIVQDEGWTALKVRKIAADIGYTVGSIYMVFANMNELNMHIKARTWQKMTLYLDDHLNKSTRSETLNEFANIFLDYAVTNAGLWRMLFEHQLPKGEPAPVWYIQQQQGVIALLYQLLKQRHPQHSDEQIRLVADTLFEGMQGICMQLIIQRQSEENISVAREHIVLLMKFFIQGWEQGRG